MTDHTVKKIERERERLGAQLKKVGKWKLQCDIKAWHIAELFFLFYTSQQ